MVPVDWRGEGGRGGDYSPPSSPAVNLSTRHVQSKLPSLGLLAHSPPLTGLTTKSFMAFKFLSEAPGKFYLVKSSPWLRLPRRTNTSLLTPENHPQWPRTAVNVSGQAYPPLPLPKYLTLSVHFAAATLL